MTNTKEELLHGSEPKKRVSNAYANHLRTFSKTDMRYWRERILKPRYQQGGQIHEAPNWAVEIQYRGRRHRLSLGTPNREAAAGRAASIDTRSNTSLANNPGVQLREETSLSSSIGLENAEKVVKTAAVVQPSQSVLLNPVFLASAILEKVVASTAVDCRLRLVKL